ncbi:MAG: ABC transporter substrate-binding protein [Alphaproteobacteria bacterium]|nr:ABC transporter substrate-binding protein [Alphaproteobacteria bacterium]
MRTRILSLAALVGALFAAAPTANAADKITAGTVGSASALLWPYYIGKAKGFFTDAGLDLDVVFVPSSAGVQQQLTAGALDAAMGTGLVDPIRAITKGADVGLVRIDGQTPPYSLLAKPAIQTIQDLKGKTISLGGLVDITRIYVEKMLAPNGIQPGQFDMVFAGATSARYAALEAGAVDAAIVLPPFTFRGESAGFRNLGTVMEYVGKTLPFAGLAVGKTWAAAHQSTTRRFVEAYTRGIAFFYDDAHRAEAIDILVKDINATPDDVTKSYDFFRKIEFFEPTGKISRARLGNLLTVLKGMGDVPDSLTVDQLVMPGVAELTD